MWILMVDLKYYHKLQENMSRKLSCFERQKCRKSCPRHLTRSSLRDSSKVARKQRASELERLATHFGPLLTAQLANKTLIRAIVTASQRAREHFACAMRKIWAMCRGRWTPVGADAIRCNKNSLPNWNPN